jgi:hypothetical protein
MSGPGIRMQDVCCNGYHYVDQNNEKTGQQRQWIDQSRIWRARRHGLMLATNTRFGLAEKA